MDKLAIYIKNLRRMKLRTVLAVIGIAIGVFSVITVISVGGTGKDFIFSEIDSLGISGLSVQSDRLPVTHRELERVESITDGAMPLIVRYSSAKLRRTDVNTVLIGAGANVCRVTGLSILHGRPFTEKEVLGAARVCVLSSDTALEAYSRENICGKEITLKLGSKEVPLKIIGVSEPDTGSISSVVGQSFPAILHMPYTTLAELCGAEGFDRISVELPEGADAEAVTASLLTALNSDSGSKNAFTVTDMDTEREKYGRILDAVTAVVSGIGGISLLVAGLMIMTLMLVSVSERSREIGIKKALGAKTRHIAAEFLTESAIISLLGGAVGVALTFAASAVLKLVTGIALTISAKVVLAGLLLSAVTGTVFGVCPAFKAAKLRPCETLRR